MPHKYRTILYLSAIASALALAALIYFMWLRTPIAARHDQPIAVTSHAGVSPVQYTGSLGWFMRHQSRDGRWSARFWDFCCEHYDPDSNTNPYRNDIAYTSLALLCFFGSGYDHKTPSTYKYHLERSMNWLTNQQDSNGSWSEQSITHALATMVICEAYAMTMDSRLKIPAQKSIEHINKQFSPNTHNGVSCLLSTQARNNQQADLLATNWSIFAIKSAKSAGLDIGNIYHELTIHYPTYIERMWHSENQLPRFPDQKHQHTEIIPLSHAISAFYFLSKRPGFPALETLHQLEFKTWQTDQSKKTKRLPDQSYFRNLAFFQYGGKDWETFTHAPYNDPSNLFDSTYCHSSSVDPSKVDGHYNRFEATVFSVLASMFTYRTRTPIKPKP